jgi:FkbM family methyltransferase
MKISFESFEKNFIANILKEIYLDKTYDRFLAGKKDLVIFDLGANIGLFSLYSLKFAKKIVAVEPSSLIFKDLEENTKEYPQITRVQAAVGSKNGSLELFGSDVNLTMFSSYKTNVHSEKSETVKQMNLSTIMDLTETKHIDFMKMDIEGSEFSVLASDDFLKVSKKIDVIMGEIHSWTGRNPNQVLVSLEECGYQVKILSQSPILFIAERE